MLYATAPTITSRITVPSNPIKPNPRLISLLLCVNEICLSLILPRSCEGVVNGLWAVCGSGDGPTRRLRRRPPRRGGAVKGRDLVRGRPLPAPPAPASPPGSAGELAHFMGDA